MSSQELDKLLGALREDTRRIEAPVHLEAALRSAFRAQSRQPARRAWMPRAIAAAAIVVIMTGAGIWMTGQPVPAPPTVRLAVAPPPPAFAFVQTAPPPAMPQVAKVKRAPRPRIVPEPQPVTEVATDFMPLEDTSTLPPIESGHVLRVQVPRSTMMRFGFPVNPDRMMDPVKADVVFGQDGIARAVRFVR
jgi:hypothetical protein